jgi:hypothetical protein
MEKKTEVRLTSKVWLKCSEEVSHRFLRKALRGMLGVTVPLFGPEMPELAIKTLMKPSFSAITLTILRRSSFLVTSAWRGTIF